MVYQVMIADDCRMIRQMFGEMLKNAVDRYSLAGTAENAEQAVAFCRSHPVDPVIMDVVMSTGKDGLEAAAVIKESIPQTKILLVTSMPEAAKAKYNEFANDFVKAWIPDAE